MEPRKDVTPVSIVDTEKPVSVIIEDDKKEAKFQNKDSQQILAPKTTEEEDRVALGQRNINLIWETTQSRIALTVIYVGMFINLCVVIILLFSVKEITPIKVALITGSIAAVNLTTGIIIGFYFSRTNHSAIGGSGKKTPPSEQGTR